MHIAIVGAGLSGLCCARELQAQGHTVVVYEKNAELGGRAGTRQTEIGGFDHGAQYFTARSPDFQQEVVHWRKSGWVEPWNGKLVALEEGVSKPAGTVAERARQRFVATPGMASLAEHLAVGIDVRFDQWAKRIEADNGKWLLSVSNASDGEASDANVGPFDAVLVAAPSVRAHPLLQVVPEFAKRAEDALFGPCWVLLLGFPTSLELGYDGAWVQASRLAWIAHDSSKPARRPGEHWICHATMDWSIEHYGDDDERVKEKLLKAFHEATGSHVQPVYASVHRWRFAQAVKPLEGDCLWDANTRIGACGDWFAAGQEGAGRIENAVLSGFALARSVGQA